MSKGFSLKRNQYARGRASLLSFDIIVTTDYGVPRVRVTVTAGVCHEQGF